MTWTYCGGDPLPVWTTVRTGDMRGQAGASSLEGRVDAATCCGQLYHLQISAVLDSLFHIQRTEGALA